MRTTDEETIERLTAPTSKNGESLVDFDLHRNFVTRDTAGVKSAVRGKRLLPG